MMIPDEARRVPWAIEFEGNRFVEAHLTLYAASQAMTIAGGSWTDLHPLESPDHLIGLLAAFLEQEGEVFAEATLRVAALPMTTVLAMVVPA